MSLYPCAACGQPAHLQAVDLCRRHYRAATELAYSYVRQGPDYRPAPGTVRAEVLAVLDMEMLSIWESRSARRLEDYLAGREPRPSLRLSDDLRVLLSAPHRADTPHRRARLARMELR